MRKRILSLCAAVAAAVVLMTAGAAVAVTTYRIGGLTVRQHIATSSDWWLVPGPNTWQTVPSTSIGVTVTGRQLITARFGAESQCLGSGWCSVRVVYSDGGPLVELAPQSGSDYAFDSDGDKWAQHSVERTSALYLPAGTYRVMVQAMRVNASQWRLDDYHLNVGLISP